MGRDKAFLEVGGREMLERVLDACAEACPRGALVVDRPDPYAGALRRYGWEERDAVSAPPRDAGNEAVAEDPARGAPGPGRSFRRAGVGLRMLRDRRPGQGPLAGIEAGLPAAGGVHCFVAACDLPFLTSGVVDRLLGTLEEWVEVGPGAGGRRSGEEGARLAGGHGGSRTDSPPRPYAAAVVPEVGGRPQPLCAAYGAGAADEASACLEEGERRMSALLDRLQVRTVEARGLWTAGDEATPDPFLNVNRPEELERARGLARGEG